MIRTIRCYWRCIGLAVLLCLFVLTRCVDSPVYAGEPPMLLIFDKPATLYAPNGARIDVPAGTEIDACTSLSACPALPDGCTLDYALDPAVTQIPEPCVERPLFADGFE